MYFRSHIYYSYHGDYTGDDGGKDSGAGAFVAQDGAHLDEKHLKTIETIR